MHPKIEKLEENKSYDKYLLKLKVDLSEAIKKREASQF
jgi:tRNA-binding EMAP/Myf-like protein